MYFLELIVQMRSLLTQTFEASNCLRFRFEADNSYAEFNTVDEAFTAVTKANRALHDARLMLIGDEPFTICTGIGFGHCLDAGHEGLYGDQMNLASKLGEDTADGREILITEEAYANLSEDLRATFTKKEAHVSGLDFNYYQHDCTY